MFSRGRTSISTPQERRETNCTKYGENKAPSLLHQTQYFGTDALLRFEMKAAKRHVLPKIGAKFHTLWPQNAEWNDQVDSTVEPVVYIWRFTFAVVIAKYLGVSLFLDTEDKRNVWSASLLFRRRRTSLVPTEWRRHEASSSSSSPVQWRRSTACRSSHCQTNRRC